MEEKKWEDLLERVRHLIEVGTALSSEHRINHLLDKILKSAQKLTYADGASIYIVTPDQKLRFEISTSQSLQFHFGGEDDEQSPFPDIPLYTDGKANNHLIVAYAATQNKVVNIKDAYFESGFDFSGPKLFDERTGYRTKSVLAVPMRDHERRVIGILQLVNAYNPHTKKVIPFSEEDEYLAQSFASEAGVALTNQRLISELKTLFESFVRVIARTIDQKSPFTGNHSRRVPMIAEMLARAVNETKEGPLKDVFLSEEDIYELKMAAFLHDCGKITTPTLLIEKHSKLESIYDRMETVATRFEVLQRDIQIDRLVKKLEWYERKYPEAVEMRNKDFQNIDDEYDKKKASLNYDLNFLQKCNKASHLTDEMVGEIERISKHMWRYQNQYISLLNADEVENLSIKYGNLTEKERKIIENHVVLTKKILSEIPFPKNLSHVPEIAGDHHERADGKGYPLGKTNDQLSLAAKILIIADIFEALSAPDRPYKEPLGLSTIHKILSEKVEDGHLDKDLVKVFLNEKIGIRYGEKHLAPNQLDV